MFNKKCLKRNENGLVKFIKNFTNFFDNIA